MKKLVVVGFLFYLLCQWKVGQVEKFDHLKRKEQRAMQNKEAEDVYDKKARFVLFRPDGEQFNEETVLLNNRQ